MVTGPSSFQIWTCKTPEEEEPGLCLTHPFDVCLSLGQGCHLLTLVSLRALCWVCGSFFWEFLYNRILPSQFDGSCALNTDILFQIQLCFGLQVPCVVCGWWVVSSDSRVELSQGMLLMQLPECKVLRDLSWPQALRSCLCPLKGSSCGCLMVRVSSGRPMSSKLSRWDLSSSPHIEQPFLLTGQWKWETLGFKMTVFRKKYCCWQL